MVAFQGAVHLNSLNEPARVLPRGILADGLPDALIAAACAAIACDLAYLILKRGHGVLERLLWGGMVLALALACEHAVEARQAWSGAGRYRGAVKVATALAGVLTVANGLLATPKVLADPTPRVSLDLGRALRAEQREKRAMEGQLKDSEDRFRLLVEAVADYAIFMLDPEGRITSWNSGAERMTGYSEAEILGRPFSMFFLAEDLAKGKAEAVLRQAAQEGRIVDEGWRLRKDGRRFLAHGVFTAFYDARGAVTGFAKVTRDITEQRETHEALQALARGLEDKVEAQVKELRESEAKLLGFIRHSPAAIAFKDLEGRFLLINPRMEAVIGKPAGEILGRKVEELFSPETCARIRELDQRVLVRGQEFPLEHDWLDPTGARRQALSHLFPLVDATGHCWGMGIIATDMTERREADRALLQSQKLESLGVLAGGIAHDFNNLLGAMQGNVELALEEATLDLARPHLDTLKGLMAKGSDLLRQMLVYAGRGQPALTALDLNRLVGEMAQLLRTSISKKATIRQELHPGPLTMEGDASKIQQVLMNLVINASEALDERNGVITLKTSLEELDPDTLGHAYEGQALEPGPYVAMEVSDNGAGMPPEVLKKIFDPFFTTKFTGRGLGLAALHGIVRSHRGGIRVQSLVGSGSSFKILFPYAEPLPPPPVPPPSPEASRRAPPRGTILVVDDEAPMRAVTVKALERMGLPVLEARDGQEALGVFEAHQDEVRLILMDFTMPNMDGEEACRELRRRGLGVPVILTSGFNEADALARFQGLGLKGFLQKPFGLGELVELVGRALSGE